MRPGALAFVVPLKDDAVSVACCHYFGCSYHCSLDDTTAGIWRKQRNVGLHRSANALKGLQISLTSTSDVQQHSRKDWRRVHPRC